MSLLLHIDTAVDTAIVSIAKEGSLLSQLSNDQQKDHGAFLQPAIKSLLGSAGHRLSDLSAIAVAAGPGSYTGLRVGMASAKGLSFALKKPLITIGSLDIIAFAAISDQPYSETAENAFFCPMIDARRMEVFTALYDREMRMLIEPSAVVLEADSFANWMLKNETYFFGNGAKKWAAICNDQNARFIPPANNALAMSILSFRKFSNNDFSDTAYAEPVYIKQFQTSASGL